MDEPGEDELRRMFGPRLRAELDELRQQSDDTSADRKPVTLDQQSVGRLSRMDAMQAQAMAEAVNVRRKQRQTLIQQALQRMEQGEFGYCLACGDFIGLKRLEIDPASTHCVACAK
ncbi:TraR/DksA C4-type zinc finger protein [Parvibaculum sp.]|jgi:DnaK suppressor protein|uniref:TraR/DksA family transcriptional regulator n=1 Tax=Parvibaculum sp. TaxID=2024848 RepID=UPI000C58D94A|nr:TraR/DksA C4-type zinc finger protein [Parvibaculum sp.]HAC57772.1 molecular chaperone DnaK [Rhodobiaceae bacterium]MAU60590.1 molecular chaperone DnaK [Parvibaculum sp.]MBO6667468.1 TraR/DksA C4-type zinc finger protein [Parvibaculum sp.]MBO6692217.1 TraR/DksA C4-type zinc finger protein [Parvibaculum sp.]MBO6714020.1 TraR/DksA C4-type zinc finger protein [Parvibaculum sp.]|tara:strand:+ start:387 stop:734 length:348 start_codon:yes stop_codon:yes gene_type:complete